MDLWQRPDIIQQLGTAVDFERLERIRLERAGWIRSKHWGPKTESLRSLVKIRDALPGLNIDFSGDYVSVHSPDELNSPAFEYIESMAESLKPWRKGPFQLFNLTIDSEWRSNLKWDRISDILGNLADQRVLDVGCGNGYYMFRACQSAPELVLGLDPSVPFFLQFEMIQHFVQASNLQIELLGAEHLDLFDQAFDVVLCMGILYHQKNPLQILKDLWKVLRPGGYAVIESQIIPGDESVALFPEDRYAKARNVYFVPTESCLRNWVKRAGFKSVETFSVETTTLDEQRKTRWSTFESLEDFLDPEDSSITVEGYPAPMRAALRAYR